MIMSTVKQRHFVRFDSLHSNWKRRKFTWNIGGLCGGSASSPIDYTTFCHSSRIALME